MQQRIGAFFAVLFLLFSAFCWKLVQDLPKTPLTHAELGLDFFPMVCIIAITILSLLLLVRTFLFPTNKQSLPMPVTAQGLWRMCGMLVLMTGYAATYEWLGFYVATWVFTIAGLYVVRERRPVVLLLFPVALVGAIYLGFVTILGVVLPEGDLFYTLFPTDM